MKGFTGLIGFFDILGYQNFLENNSAPASALEVLDIIANLPNSVNATAKRISKIREFEGYSEELKHLVFSDSILLTLAYPATAGKNWIKAARSFMAVISSKLAAEMFEKGLPLRGVLHEGEFITKEACFAGKGIVEAYKLCSSLNYSSLICTQFLGDKISGDWAAKDLPKLFFQYLTPVRDGNEKKFLNINWIQVLGEDERQKCQLDVDNYVLKSFWSHNKDCPSSVDAKVHNTAKVIRRMLQHRSGI